MRYVKRKQIYGIYNTDDIQGEETGKTLEQAIAKLMEEGEPLDTSAPIIYTARKDKVRPEYDIRTDRFEIAQEAMTKTAKSIVTRREERYKINYDVQKLKNKEKSEESEKNQQS